ncbi:MAG: phosphate transport system regulatory protein PhoU [Mesorhizobium sp.]|nr:MAG: phosphate transport system regulatory protein PhoU [Mesorhizobium sp.]
MQSVHIVSAYDEELKYLSKRIAAMGGHAERMVEQAIAKRVVAVIEGRQPTSLFRGIAALADLALTQLKEVLDVYASRSVEKIGFVRDRDDQIDAVYTSLFRELLTYMMEDPRNITPCTHLLFCAKNIERIGDHATNIAETIYYIVTGDQMPAERPKGDKTDKIVLPATLPAK